MGFEALEPWKRLILNRSREEATHFGSFSVSSPLSLTLGKERRYKIKKKKKIKQLFFDTTTHNTPFCVFFSTVASKHPHFTESFFPLRFPWLVIIVTGSSCKAIFRIFQPSYMEISGWNWLYPLLFKETSSMN